MLSALSDGVIDRAAIAHAILVKPGVEKWMNAAGRRPWNVTTALHGCVTALATNSRPGASSRMAHPTAGACARKVPDGGGGGGRRRRRLGKLRSAKSACTIHERLRSRDQSTAYAVSLAT
jgi:hypothetical protein